MKKLPLLLLALLLVSGCKFGGEINVTPQEGDPILPGQVCEKCPDPIVCPPPTVVEVIKEVPVEVIKEVPVIQTIEKIVEKIVEVPIEVIKTIIQPAPQYKYTHSTPLQFTYFPNRAYRMEIVAGVIKMYENNVLILTKNPDKTETV